MNLGSYSGDIRIVVEIIHPPLGDISTVSGLILSSISCQVEMVEIFSVYLAREALEV